MKTIVEIEHNLPCELSIYTILKALKEHLPNTKLTVRALPQPEQGQEGKTCSNCGNNRGTSSMPCLICGGAVTPCNYSHWQPIPPDIKEQAKREVEAIDNPTEGWDKDIRCYVCHELIDFDKGFAFEGKTRHPDCHEQPIPAKVDDKNPCRLKCPSPHIACNDFIPVRNNRGFCFNCGHHKSCHAQGEG